MDRTLSDMVREARLEKGYSQEHLGELIGYSQRMISEIENKPDRYPRDRTMRLLADALGLDITDMYIAANLAANRKDAERIALALETDLDSPAKRYYLRMAELKTWPAARTGPIEEQLRRWEKEDGLSRRSSQRHRATG